MSCFTIHSNCRQYYRYMFGSADGMCFPKSDLIQYNNVIEDGVWIDEIGKHVPAHKDGGCIYVFNAVDNYLQFQPAFYNSTITYKLDSGTEHTTTIGATGIGFELLLLKVQSFVVNGITWNLEETKGSIAFSNVDGVTATIHGDIVDFHDTDASVPSVANQIGYGVSATGVIIPVNSHGNPVIACADSYKGRARFDLEFVDANAFTNNNTDNVVDIGLVVYTSDVSFGFMFHPAEGTRQALGCNYSSGIWWIQDDGRLAFKDNNGDYSGTNVYITDDRPYILFLKHYALLGVNYADVYVDNVKRDTITYATNIVRFRYANLCYNAGTFSVKKALVTLVSTDVITDEQALNWKGYKINGGSNEMLIPFVQGAGSTVTDVNSNTDYNIAGAVDATSWVKQSKYFNSLEEGFSSYSDVELVTNGDFATGDLTGWGLSSRSNTTVEGNAMKITNTSGYGKQGQRVICEIGKSYILNWSFLGYSASTTVKMHVGVALGDASMVNDAAATVSDNSIEFIATIANPIITAICNTTHIGSYVIVDNISIRRIDIIPASQVVGQEGNDVNGNTLTNPAILDASGKLIGNNGGALVQQKNLGLYPADSHWYNADGSRKQLTVQELLPNVDNKYYANVIDQDKDVRQLLGYGVAQSVENQNKISLCQLKHVPSSQIGLGFVLDMDGTYALDMNGLLIPDNTGN